MRIGFCTDSTTDMPAEFYREHDVRMVPLTVRFGEETYKDWVEMPPDIFYARLRGVTELPKTTQPSPADFLAAYNDLAERFDHVISFHLSSRLSGTVQSAEIAAKDSPVPVTVVDGRLASLGTGLALDGLLRARNRGAGLDGLVEMARGFKRRLHLVFNVATLRYLQMGGRIGKAAALAGALLSVRPLLVLDDEGVVDTYRKVKGESRVYQEMVDYVVERGGLDRPIRLALAHADSPPACERLREMLREAGVVWESLTIGEIGSVIGTYLGPDAFAAAFYVEE